MIELASGGDWLIRERGEIARQLLETSMRPLTHASSLAGFGSEESFRRHFRLATGLGPMAYQRQFGASDPVKPSLRATSGAPRR